MRNKQKKSHLLIKNSVKTSNYVKPRGGGGGNDFNFPVRDRVQHSHKLITQLTKLKPKEESITTKQKEFGLKKRGVHIEFASDPDFDLKLERLENQRAGIELCSTHLHEDGSNRAVVFIPEGKIDFFIQRVEEYRDKDHIPTEKSSSLEKKSDIVNTEIRADKPKETQLKPKHQDLVGSISEIKLAILISFWVDDYTDFPANENQLVWWEVWIRLTDNINTIPQFRNHLKQLGFEVSAKSIKFVNRAVFQVYGTAKHLSETIDLLNNIVELRKVKEDPYFFTDMSNIEQSEWKDELLSRIKFKSDKNSYICILDSGVNSDHPVLKPVTCQSDMHSINPSWGIHDGDRGHGTPMAGLAAYGDLTEALSLNSYIEIKHGIESVKILPNSKSHQNQADLYGAIMQDSIATVEIDHPERRRTFCLAITASENIDRGRPSSWSASIDQLAYGDSEDENSQRLILISSGNAVDAQLYSNYPANNFTDSVQDPAQAWNALTVGGYTDKFSINSSEACDYTPIAPKGGLAPSSCTSMTWSDSSWPFKPDIVMEAGNYAIDRNLGTKGFVSSMDSLGLLSTNSDFNSKLFISFGDTSGATALASRLCAQVTAKYPEYWPETIRALLVHSAEWTPAMLEEIKPKNKTDFKKLLKMCGYGVPNEKRLFWSASNSLTLVAQDYLTPFQKVKSKIKTRSINIHEIPWPTETLRDLGAEEVKMRVTLSYFIEPNPGQRGWINKYKYASHRLQFDVKRPLENRERFEQRINQTARDESFNTKDNAVDSGDWLLGANNRTSGSIHSDTWSGTAVELADRQYIAVYPLNGWWKELKKHERWDNQIRYSLVVSITTPETDIYTEVENQIRSMVLI